MIHPLSPFSGVNSRALGPRRQRRAPRRLSRLFETLEPRTLLSSVPTGSVEVLNVHTISGWVFNADDGANPLNVSIAINNGTPTTIIANQTRSDLATRLGSPNHAFTYTMPDLPTGANTVTVTLVDPYTNFTRVLKSTTLNIAAPSGAVTVFNSATISGWAFSAAEGGDPIHVVVTLDNVPTNILANRTSSDLIAKVGSADHAFSFTVPSLVTGTHTITIDAVDPTTQALKRLRTGTIVIAPPSGAVNVLNNSVISGWAFSAAHNADPVTVLITVNGNEFTLRADDPRSDLTARLGSASHAFSFALPALQPGVNTVTVDALDNSTSQRTRIRTGTINIGAPVGSVETFNATTISGWAFSPAEGAAPLDVVVTINGGDPQTISADDPRPDLVAKYGSAYHGFSYTLPTLSPGKNSITVDLVDPFTKQTKRLKTGTLLNALPAGGVDIHTDTRIAGWVSDANTAGSLQVQIMVDGVALGAPIVADDSRRLKGTTPIGFDVSGNFAGKVVEVFALDNPSGQLVRIWTNNHSPHGALESATGTKVTGWAVDPDAPATPVSIRVDIDGITLTTVTANLPRANVQAKAGALNVGYSVDIPGLTPGSHVIAVYAIDGQATGTAPVLLGKKTVVNAPPVGHVDSLTSTLVSGWALDPDLGAAPATVYVYVDDVLTASTTANLPSSGVPAKYGKANHGFSVNLNVSTASHSVTVVVLDNRVSDSQEVVIADDFVNNHVPTGAVETLTGAALTGWARDVDAGTNPIDVEVYVDGKLAGTVTADQADAQVPNHGFVITFASLFEGEGLTFGTHTIDLYASESQKNVEVLIGSQTVTNHRPIGVIESAVATGSATTITGWAADPDQLGHSVNVRVYINGVPADPALAQLPRADLLSLIPLSSAPSFSKYGFVLSLPALSAGTNRIDVYAQDLDNSQFSMLGSLTLIV